MSKIIPSSQVTAAVDSRGLHLSLRPSALPLPTEIIIRTGEPVKAMMKVSAVVSCDGCLGPRKGYVSQISSDNGFLIVSIMLNPPE